MDGRSWLYSRAQKESYSENIMSSSLSPNPTLYINNLNDKINKDELKSQLYSLFMTYGRVIDIVAQKGAKMKGQAFLAFADLAEATTAMRALDGMLFYDKPLVRPYPEFSLKHIKITSGLTKFFKAYPIREI